MRTKTILEKSENDLRTEERTCPTPRFRDGNLSVPQMGNIFRDARHYVCTILELKCKQFIGELTIMRNHSSHTDLKKEIEQIPDIIFTGTMNDREFMDAIRNTFGITYESRLKKSFPMICKWYETITDDAREIIHLNNLLVAMIKGSSMASNFDNLARVMNYQVEDMEGKR